MILGPNVFGAFRFPRILLGHENREAIESVGWSGMALLRRRGRRRRPSKWTGVHFTPRGPAGEEVRGMEPLHGLVCWQHRKLRLVVARPCRRFRIHSPTAIRGGRSLLVNVSHRCSANV
jgi:hypothetical protein